MKKNMFVMLTFCISFFSTFCAENELVMLIIDQKAHSVPQEVSFHYNDLLNEISLLKRENTTLKKQNGSPKKQVILFNNHLVDEEVREAYLNVRKSLAKEREKKEGYKKIIKELQEKILQQEAIIRALEKEIEHLTIKKFRSGTASPLHREAMERQMERPISAPPCPKTTDKRLRPPSTPKTSSSLDSLTESQEE